MWVLVYGGASALAIGTATMAAALGHVFPAVLIGIVLIIVGARMLAAAAERLAR